MENGFGILPKVKITVVGEEAEKETTDAKEAGKAEKAEGTKEAGKIEEAEKETTDTKETGKAEKAKGIKVAEKIEKETANTKETEEETG